MSTPLYIDPTKYFVYKKNGNLEDCPIKTAQVNAIAVATNQQIVAAVTGKKIRVVGGTMYSNGAASAVNFIDGSGGAGLKALFVPANTVSHPNVLIAPEINEQFETSAGVGLFANNSAVLVICTVNYIEYTP